MKFTSELRDATCQWDHTPPDRGDRPCQKHLAQAFLYVFFHSHPFNGMFSVSGKSNCCNDTFTDVRFTWLQAKNI